MRDNQVFGYAWAGSRLKTGGLPDQERLNMSSPLGPLQPVDNDKTRESAITCLEVSLGLARHVLGDDAVSIKLRRYLRDMHQHLKLQASRID